MPMPPKQPTEPAITPITGWYSRSSTMAAWISAMAARPRLASCRRTPPVSSSSTARVGMPLRLSSAASSSAPAILAPPTSPMLPPWNAPSIAAITAGRPSMLPLATTTPSSAWVTMPCLGSQGEVTRSKGSISSRKLPSSNKARARWRAPSSTKLRDCSRRAISLMANLLQSLFQTQAYHAGGCAEVVNIDVQCRQRLLAEHPLEQLLPTLFGTVDRGDHADRQLAGLAGLEQYLQITRADHADQSLATGGLPGGE